MDAPLRIGLVGCGRLALAGYVPAACARHDVRIVAVADPAPDARTEVAGRLADLRPPEDIGAFPDADTMLDRVALDAVVVASPVAAHAADAASAAERGVPCLVEKPPATDADAAGRLALLQPAPWIGFNRRFDPGARSVRDAVPGEGPLAATASISYRRRSWSPRVVRDDALLDLGPHLVDWVLWSTQAGAIEVSDAELSSERASFRLRTTRGTADVAAATGSLHAELLEVRAPTGIVARHRVGGPVAAVLGRIRPRSGESPLVATLVAQLGALAAAVRGGRAPDLGTAREGAEVMAVIDAARLSAANFGAAVPVHRSPEQ